MKAKKYQVWECKVMVPEGALPNGFDSPPRQAVIAAIESAGIEVLGCSSGWAGSLTEAQERAFNQCTGDVYYAGTLDTNNEIKH